MNKITNPTRLFDFAYYQQQHFPQDHCLADRVNGKWAYLSTDELIDRAHRISRALLRLGIQPGDKVALISNNRSEWNVMDLGIMQIGAIDVPVYPTISEKDYTFIFNDAEVKLCVVSDEELYAKVNNIRADVPTLGEIYTFNQVEGAKHWSELLELGAEGDRTEVEALMAQVKAEDLATLIYTSGTTGLPKGVMLSHLNIASNVMASRERLPVNETAKGVSFLPLCHVYERMLVYLYLYTGVSLHYAESLETIGDDIRDVQPEVFSAVPRLLEKVYAKIIAKGEELTGIKRGLFFWAVNLAESFDTVNRSAWYNFRLGIARKLIFSKWQAALGGNVKAVASGSAALNPRLARIFQAAGINVLEGYGLTETSPVVSVNGPDMDHVRIGSVGRLIRDVEVKIAEDGEILVKGPNVMMGYYKRPDLTDEVMKDGWFHTGDIGTMVEGVYLKITDRKKEIFKTSGGKYIIPQAMENRFKESRFIEQLMIIGEAQKHPAALIQLDYVFVREWCKRKGIDVSGKPDVALAEIPEVVARVQREVDEINPDFGKWEQVKKFALTPSVWSIDSGELTPTLKLRRKPILEKYANLVNEIYAD